MIKNNTQDEPVERDPNEVLSQEIAESKTLARYAWNGPHSAKYPGFSAIDKFFTREQLSEGEFPFEEHVKEGRELVSVNETRSDSSHLNLLPDTGTTSTTFLDFEPVTGKPAWLHSAPKQSFSLGDDPGRLRTTWTGSAEIRNAPSERAGSRWFALKHIFGDGDDQEEGAWARAAEPRIPCMAVFSMAGGVGKTSLVATLGRALSAYGERMLLVDTTSSGLLPFYFGARELRPGVVRTFTAPGSTDAPVYMVSIDPDDPALQIEQPADARSDWFVDAISRHARGASRILIDLATASGSVTRRLLKLTPTVLVPLTPDMNSVVSLTAIEALFRKPATNFEATHSEVTSGETAEGGATLGGIPGRSSAGMSRGKLIQPYYLINQFDPSIALHLDVREVMREQLGDRLLPFTLRRDPVVSEAMAQGMTVMDYAPHASVAEEYMALAGWIRSVSAPATPGYRGVRWSERSV